MPIIRLPDSSKGSAINILHIHIPKCGGTAVENYFKSIGAQINLKGEFKELKGIVKCETQHFTIDILEKIIHWDSLNTSFAIIRNPYARLASEYRYRKGQIALVSEAERHGITKIRYDNIKDWTHKVLDLYLEDNSVLSNHIRPLSDFLSHNIPYLPIRIRLDSIIQK